MTNQMIKIASGLRIPTAKQLNEALSNELMRQALELRYGPCIISHYGDDVAWITEGHIFFRKPRRKKRLRNGRRKSL